MRTSPIWTATYQANADDEHCWSITWGERGGPRISAEVAYRIAKKFMEDHRVANGEVPALLGITFLYPYPHSITNIRKAFFEHEAHYHEKYEKEGKKP